MFLKVCLVLCVFGSTLGRPQEKPEFWKGTALDSTVENLRHSCAENENLACFQFKAFSFLDNVLRGGYFQQLSENVQITRNLYKNEIGTKRSAVSIEDVAETFIKSHDVTFQLPVVGDLTVDPRHLDDEELNFKLNFGSGSNVEERGKKSKLKKVFIPILTFILLKAITVVPFILGVLAFKAWNGLQLSLFSFVIASGLAIFQLCQKLATDSSHAPVIVDHPPAQYKARSLEDDSQNLAYSAYV